MHTIVPSVSISTKYQNAALVWLLIFSSLAAFFPNAQAQAVFNFDTLTEKAKLLAQQDYLDPTGKVPDYLLELDYDHWRDIRFKSENRLWHGEKLPFELDFFHPGLFYDRSVAINVIDSEKVSQVPFSSSLFNYGKNDFSGKVVPDDLGFAGFTLRYPVNTPAHKDAVAVFLGASYFRAVAKGQNFGLSARGVAVNTGLRGGEEFPYFKEYWLEKPAVNAEQIIIYALLDSPSMTGAYQFIIRPDTATLMDVKTTLFQRKKIEKLGIAPLTSMFFYGENTNIRPANDFRSEVHDSDGLMIAAGGGEWIWRPLINPKDLEINSFITRNPVGFGLVQRDNNFDHYQDLEAHYEQRPNVWLTPSENWGDGHVELIQIPTNNEANDNIVAFWVPATIPDPGIPLSFNYKVLWGTDNYVKPPAGFVQATRINQGKSKDSTKFIVDFMGSDLEALPFDANIESFIETGAGGSLVESQLQKNAATGGWRLVFEIAKKDDVAIDLRAYLKQGKDIITETWNYSLLP